MKQLLVLFSLLALGLALNRTQMEMKSVIEKMVKIAKNGGPVSAQTVSAQMNKLAQTVCPDSTCCITIWLNGAPTDGLTTAPCTNQVLYVSGDAIVAGCNVVAVTAKLPNYVSSGCSLNQFSFTSVQPASSCGNSNDLCVTGGSDGPSVLNIGPSGCANIGPCDCNAGAPTCDYPTAALILPGFCNSHPGICGSFYIGCDSGDSNCDLFGDYGVCFTTAEGSLVCASDFSCSNNGCNSSPDCGTGGVCIVNTCCGPQGVCSILCPNVPLEKSLKMETILTKQSCGSVEGVCEDVRNNCADYFQKVDGVSYACMSFATGCKKTKIVC